MCIIFILITNIHNYCTIVVQTIYLIIQFIINTIRRCEGEDGDFCPRVICSLSSVDLKCYPEQRDNNEGGRGCSSGGAEVASSALTMESQGSTVTHNHPTPTHTKKQDNRACQSPWHHDEHSRSNVCNVQVKVPRLPP